MFSGQMTEYEELSPNFRKAIIEKMKITIPFWKLLGMEVMDVKKGRAIMKLPFSEKLTQPDGVAHGGAIFSLADTSVATALLGLIDRNETMLTVEMKINYIKAAKGGEILSEAKIIHRGSNTAIGDVEVRNSEGELLAKCLATYMIIKK